MEENEFQPRILYLVKLSTRCENRKKALAEMQDFKYPFSKKCWRMCSIKKGSKYGKKKT